MAPQEPLVDQVCALPLAERLQLRAALEDSVERDLASVIPLGELDEDLPALRERLEAQLQEGLASGPPITVDALYWQELQGRIARRRATAS